MIATTDEGTRAALAEVRQRSAQLNPDRLVLLIPHLVSHLTAPSTGGPRETAIMTARYREMATQAGIDVIVRVCVCRRYDELFKWMLDKQSLIVVGGRRRWWWHTTAQDLARRLRSIGHHVVFADVARSP